MTVLTLTAIYDPTAFLLTTGEEESLVLFTANFTTEVIASDILPAHVVRELQSRLRKAIAAAPTKAALETGFVGLVRALVGVRQLETGDFAVAVTYVAPVASFELNDLATPAHVAIAIPHSVSSPLLGVP